MTRRNEQPDVTLRDVYQSIEHLRREIADSYVTKAEFAPVKSIAYGVVGLILVTVVGALLTGVVRAN